MTIEALMKVHSGKVKGVLIETSPVAEDVDEAGVLDHAHDAGVERELEDDAADAADAVFDGADVGSRCCRA